jgi:hypothetical protein
MVCDDPRVDAAVVDRVAKAVSLARRHWGDLPERAKEILLFHFFSVVPETRAVTGFGPVGNTFDAALLTTCEQHSMREVDDEVFVRRVREIYCSSSREHRE